MGLRALLLFVIIRMVIFSEFQWLSVDRLTAIVAELLRFSVCLTLSHRRKKQLFLSCIGQQECPAATAEFESASRARPKEARRLKSTTTLHLDNSAGKERNLSTSLASLLSSTCRTLVLAKPPDIT
jgi:hypothetical protein